jgi:fructokinase
MVVAGESLVDLIVGVDATVTAVPGGGPYNVARALARLGGSCAYLGTLSADRFGRTLRDGLTSAGVDDRLAPSTELPTTLAVAELDESGSAAYRFYTDGTSAPALDRDEAAAALGLRPSAVYVGTLGLVLEPVAPSLEGLVDALPADALLVLDPNCRPAAITEPDAYAARLRRLLGRADVVKVSTEDLDYLATTDVGGTAAELLALGPGAVLVTDGGRAVRVATGAGTHTVGVPSVDVVDTVGAGDGFVGGFLAWCARHGMTRDRVAATPAALVPAVEFAVTVAAITCQRAGADPPWAHELPGEARDRLEGPPPAG